MTQIPIMNTKGTATGKANLPVQFSEPVRPDLIKRAVEAVWNNNRQPYGTDPRAGKRASAKVSRRRHNYRGSYGQGLSRVPRKVMSHNGTQFAFMGAFAPGTVKGYRAHPPKAFKIWDHKINRKERTKALRSALAATMQPAFVEKRGHKPPKQYPFILAEDAEATDKTQDVHAFLMALGFEQELARSSEKSIRAGKGKTRGRPYKKRKGPLIVVSGQCKLWNAARNIPGLDVCDVHRLDADQLAPGAVPGRLTLFTSQALAILAKEELFT